jgi:hypothetical protein
MLDRSAALEPACLFALERDSRLFAPLSIDRGGVA